MSYVEDEGYYYDEEMYIEECERREKERKKWVIHDSGNYYDEICIMLEDTFEGLRDK